MLAANLLFTFVDSLTKFLLISGYAALQLAFMRYAAQFVVTIFHLLKQDRAILRAARPHFPLIILRGIILATSTMVNFWALQYLSLTVTSSIMFSAPIIVCAVSGPLLGERPGPFRWFAIGVGFLGVLCVIRPWSDSLSWAAMIMLIPATGMALYSILTRHLAGQVHSSVLQAMMGLIGTILIGPLALIYWMPVLGFYDWLLMFSLGLFA